MAYNQIYAFETMMLVMLNGNVLNIVSKNLASGKKYFNPNFGPTLSIHIYYFVFSNQSKKWHITKFMHLKP